METKSVLLVDDVALFRRAATLMVTEALPDVEVHSAANGALALAVLEANPVDLLVTDLAMPVLGGTGLLAGVLRIGRPLPVIAMTGTTSPDFIAWARASSALGVMPKPVRFDALSEVIRRQLAEGSIAPLRLEVLCRLLALELASVELQIASPTVRGSLHFFHGVLRHAETTTMVGVAAAEALLSAQRVFPELRPLAPGSPVTILEPLTAVLERVQPG